MNVTENTRSVHSLALICIDRLALGALQVATTPPMYHGRLPTCWASSAWYEPATGARSKSATPRTASPRVASIWPRPAQLEGQTTRSFFLILIFKPLMLSRWRGTSVCLERSVLKRCTVRWRVWNVLENADSLSKNLMYDAYSSTRTQILPPKNPPKCRI